MVSKLTVVTLFALLGLLMVVVRRVDAGVNHGLQTYGFGGAGSYGQDAGAGGYAGRSVVSPLASSGFASPYGAIGGNYLTGLNFLHDGSSAGFGGFGSSGKHHG